MIFACAQRLIMQLQQHWDETLNKQLHMKKFEGSTWHHSMMDEDRGIFHLDWSPEN